MSNLPMFIIGSPRSGTTLLRLMLNAHKNVCVPPECGFIQWLAPKYLSAIFDKKTIKEFIADLKKTKKIETWNLDFSRLEEYIERKGSQSFQEVCMCVIAFYASNGRSKSVKYLGDKNNYYIDYLDEILEIFPNAKFLFLIRDGRDVATSYVTINNSIIDSDYKPVLPNSIKKIALSWNENNKKIHDFSLKIQPSQYMFLKYEDLITEPLEMCKQICDGLGLEFDENMVHFNQFNDEPKEFIQWKEKTLEKIDSKNLGKYKQVFSDEEIFEFNKIAEESLVKFGYEL